MLKAFVFRELEVIKSSFFELFLSYAANFIFIISLFFALSDNSVLDDKNFLIMVYFLTIVQSQVFLMIFNKVDDSEGIFHAYIITFRRWIKFLVVRIASIAMINLIFCGAIIFICHEFYHNLPIEFSKLTLSLSAIIINNISVYSIIFSNKSSALSSLSLLFLVPLNLPAIIFSTNDSNFIYLSLLLSLMNVIICVFFNRKHL